MNTLASLRVSLADSLIHFVGSILVAWFILDAWGALYHWYIFGFFRFGVAIDPFIAPLRQCFALCTTVCAHSQFRFNICLLLSPRRCSLLPALVEATYIVRILICKVGKF